MKKRKCQNFFERMKVLGKRAVLAADAAVNTAAMAVCLIFAAYAAYVFWDTRTLYQKADSVVYESYKPQADADSFSELKAVNPEVFGWLTVYGTEIDYPLTQADNNSKYVNTDAKGAYSLSGSLFLDCNNASDFSDFNSIIYGHHMQEDTMFGELDKFAEEDFFEEHQYGSLYFDGADHGIEIFAFFYADAYDSVVYNTGITKKSDRQSFLDRLKEQAEQYRETGVTSQDHIVLLSTCTSDDTNGRILLAARISSENFEDPFQSEKQEQKNKTADSGYEIAALYKLPVWCYFFFLLLISLGLMIMLKRKRRNGS
ncbi:sortase%2C SrtB family [uncultured Roseburia sp.]|uniref:Class B sortase n=1 Tax=Brotonthovivens ammoniilytica TaxID=2981725 RepID=A0ABT2THB1_9FIRM|nr:class B sortase [Brotonthovivens ammoniilytica]MCU6761101.1 class B sortase [Brotonthovivens ammoniilytica]SCI18876.1 sortase%2C SrtB family [uncultured Roseburia sp.]